MCKEIYTTLKTMKPQFEETNQVYCESNRTGRDILKGARSENLVANQSLIHRGISSAPVFNNDVNRNY